MSACPGPLFNQRLAIYAAPREVRLGQKLSAGSIAAACVTPATGNPRMGTYELRGDSISVNPGPQTYHSTEGATISIDDGMVTSISARPAQLSAYELEPQLITASPKANRVKRRIVTFNEFPHPWCRPSPPSKTAASSRTAASITSASLNCALRTICSPGR